MKRTTLALAALALILVAPTRAHAETFFGFQIGINTGHPAPVYFRHRPRLVLEPQTKVYVVADNFGDRDAFRYGGFWYVCDGGYWYRASRYRGPFVSIDVRKVPRPIFYVPEERWHHHYADLAPARERMRHDDMRGRGERGGRRGD